MRTELLQKPIKDIIDKYQIPELQRLVDNEHINNMVEDQKNEYNKYKTAKKLYITDFLADRKAQG